MGAVVIIHSPQPSISTETPSKIPPIETKTEPQKVIEVPTDFEIKTEQAETEQAETEQPKPSKTIEKYAIYVALPNPSLATDVYKFLANVYKTTPETIQKRIKLPGIIGKNLEEKTAKTLAEKLKQFKVQVKLLTMTQLAELIKKQKK